MAVKVTKNRIALNEFTNPPTAASYSGANRGVLSPNRIPQTYFGENQVADNSMLDVVVGTPGTMAANMAILTNPGLTASMKANVVINGLTYTVINLAGTTNNVQIQIVLDNGTTIAASNGQVWGYAAYVAVTGANTSHVTSAHLRLTSRTSGGGFIINNDSPTFTPNATPQRRLVLATLAGGATTAFIQQVVRVVVQNAQTVDVDIYIAMNTVEQNIIRNQPVATYGYPQPSVWVPDTPIKVDPRRFGAVVDGVQATNGSWTGTDNTLAIYKACKAASRSNGMVQIPEGNMLYGAIGNGLLIDGGIDCTNFRMEGKRDSRLVMMSSGQSGSFFSMTFEGNPGSDGVGVNPTYFFTANVSKGGLSATFNTVANLYVGQWLQLIDEATPVISYDTVATGQSVCLQGQLIQIDAIDTGTKIVSFKQCFEFNYTGTPAGFPTPPFLDPATNATNVQRYITMPGEIVLENLTFDWDPTAAPLNTQYRMIFRNVGKHRIYGVDILGEGCGINCSGSIFMDMDRCSFMDGGALSYNVTIANGASFGKATALLSKNSRHMFQGSTGLASIEAAHFIVADSIGLASQLAPFSGHPGVRHIKYNSCTAIGNGEYTPSPGIDVAGFMLRGRWMEVNDCSAIGMRVGLLMIAGHDNSMNRGTLTNCKTAARIAWTDRPSMNGVIIDSPVNVGVQLEQAYYTAPYTPWPGVKIDVRINGPAPTIGDVSYVMRTPGQTTVNMGTDWDIKIDAVNRKATYVCTNVDAVTVNGNVFPTEYSFSQATKTASFVCLAGKNLTYIVTPAAIAIAVTVPDAALFTGEKSRLRFVKTGAGVGVVTLTATAGNIDGAGSKVLATFLTIESDGTNWFTVG